MIVGTTAGGLRSYGSRPAIVRADDGSTTSFAELDRRSAGVARALRAAGLNVRDHIALLIGNDPIFYEVMWGAHRAGLHYTPINWHLTASEAAFIVDDCGAKAIVSTGEWAEFARSIADLADVPVKVMAGASTAVPAGWVELERAVAAAPPEPIGDEIDGAPMLYSSGTTGRPKGILRPITGNPLGTLSAFHARLAERYGFTDDSTYLCVAPLYHAAPLLWTSGAQILGTTIVLSRKFDAEQTLAAIERFRVTHIQMVPTMFVRMLRLDEKVRARYDLTSLRIVVHAAAPCPPDVKRAMLEWLGPIIHEYYGGSEGNGVCAIGPQEWLDHPGSVGRAIVGIAHILDDEGNELPPGQNGTVYFAGGPQFAYHGDPGNTASAFNDRGWSTLGDVGYLDEEGYLFLTDRKSFVIISGGVNIYPQEIENVLSLHPAVHDIGVIGVSDDDLGETVLAVVEPANWDDVGPALEEELIAFCRQELAAFKCPRHVRFAEVPRSDAGKILKQVLRNRYSS